MPKRPRAEAALLTDDRGRSQPGCKDYRFYAEERYWDARHNLDEAFEWFAAPEVLMPLLDLLLAPARLGNAVLDLGCGTSGLLSEMRSAGFSGELTGVDFSPAAVRCSAAAARAAHSAADVPAFHCIDASDLSDLVGDGEVGVVVEKATLHGIVSSPQGEQLAEKVLKEVHRVLADGGLLVSVSGNSPHSENEATNGLNVLEELIIPPLLAAGAETGHYYTVDVHSSESFGPAHAYVLRKVRRARTRSATRGARFPTAVRLHEH